MENLKILNFEAFAKRVFYQAYIPYFLRVHVYQDAQYVENLYFANPKKLLLANYTQQFLTSRNILHFLCDIPRSRTHKKIPAS